MAIPEIPENYFMEGLKRFIALEKMIPTRGKRHVYPPHLMFAVIGEAFSMPTADEYKIYDLPCVLMAPILQGKV